MRIKRYDGFVEFSVWADDERKIIGPVPSNEEMEKLMTRTRAGDSYRRIPVGGLTAA